MNLNVAKEQAALQKLTAKQLRGRFAVVCGDPARTNNRVWLVKRIASRLQAKAGGGLSERARLRAEELADDDLRAIPPKESPASVPRTASAAVPADRADRLPPVGSGVVRPCNSSCGTRPITQTPRTPRSGRTRG